jgi:hypothetical protein
MDTSDNIAALGALLIGLGAIATVFILLASNHVEKTDDCMPACVIEGVQYMPQEIRGECWCDMKKARALTPAP